MRLFYMGVLFLLLCFSSHGGAAILNGGFENGLSNWTITPNKLGKSALYEAVLSVGAITAPEGSKMAKITVGQAGENFVDFNFFHSSLSSIASGDHVRLKIKVLYNGNGANKEKKRVFEVILKEPNNGQPLIAAATMAVGEGKFRLTNIVENQTTTTDLITNGSSGFNYETQWLNMDIDVSSFKGQTAPISFFLNGAPSSESLVYLIDDIKVAP